MIILILWLLLWLRIIILVLSRNLTRRQLFYDVGILLFTESQITQTGIQFAASSVWSFELSTTSTLSPQSFRLWNSTLSLWGLKGVHTLRVIFEIVIASRHLHLEDLVIVPSFSHSLHCDFLVLDLHISLWPGYKMIMSLFQKNILLWRGALEAARSGLKVHSSQFFSYSTSSVLLSRSCERGLARL